MERPNSPTPPLPTEEGRTRVEKGDWQTPITEPLDPILTPTPTADEDSPPANQPSEPGTPHEQPGR